MRMDIIRTRFAPSPTGSLHIGGLRTALYSFALAKHAQGDFLLRIEDTDIKREVKGATEKIKELLKLFGLKWDEYFVQSERAKEGIYEKAAKKLVEEGHAFYCDCPARNAKEEGYSKELRDPCRDKGKTSGAIKLKVPDGETVSFTDFVLQKEVSWDTSTVADTTLLKSDGFPTYHLAVVVDDNDMRISHVLRGHDWMPSTPVHLLVYQYLGYQLPEIGHLTDILDPEGGKLSKRKGSTSVEGLLAEGYLPEAILNFVMLLGWAPKDNRELFTLDEFVKAFDHSGFQKANPVFNRVKLDWFNDQYKLRQSPVEFIGNLSRSSIYSREPKFLQTVEASAVVVYPRVSNVTDFDSYIRPFFKEPQVSESQFGSNSKDHLGQAFKALNSLDNWNKEEIDKTLMNVVEKNNFNTGDFFMDLRVAITGERHTLPISDLIAYYAQVFGKKGILERINRVL